jgi:flagellar biogenesis protein FliO
MQIRGMLEQKQGRGAREHKQSRRMPEPDHKDEDAAGRSRTLLALGFVLLLVLGGVWLVDHMRTQAAREDCFMQGRSNCAPIETNP